MPEWHKEEKIYFKFLIFSLFFLIFIPSVFALGVNIPTGVAAGNYSGVGVNDSYWLRGLSPQQVADLYIETDPVHTTWLNNPIFTYNINATNVNLTTGTGFFAYLGDIITRITKGWFQDLDVSGTATINNINLTGNITNPVDENWGYFNNGSCIVIGNLSYISEC